MTEYIEREAALSAQNKSMNLNEMRERLKRIPAADVRPVVLCRDCDCWNDWDRVEDTCSCAFWSEDRLIYTKEEEFCSWGRKRMVAADDFCSHGRRAE